MQPSALVTGSSSGIGAAACRRLRQEGWHVTGLARRASPEASVSRCVDISIYPDVVAVVEAMPTMSLLVHSAAIIGPVAPVSAGDPDEWRQAVEINLLGTYHVLRAVLSGPLARNGGTVIHLTSGAASVTKPYWSAYGAAKAGAEHLARSAATEVDASTCAICCLDPGITETAMQRELRSRDFPDRERFVRIHEEGSARSAEDVAEAIVELTTREPSAIAGRTFRVGHL